MFKEKAVEVMQVCIMRHEAGRRCQECIYNGRECLEMHRRAYYALQITTNENIKEAKHDYKIGK